MPRIRTIKPEFWDDELVASLSRDARLLFIASWNLADDEGRLRWSPAYIKSKVFPYDEDLTVTDVGNLMAELEKSGRVRAYEVTETITQTFAVVVNFPRHQRINRAQDSSLPPPPPDGPGTGKSTRPFTERSVNGGGAPDDPTRRDQQPITSRSAPEGKGRERKGKDSPSASLPDGFPDFWAAYPRKVDKRTAEKAYRAAIKRGATPEQLKSAAVSYAESQRNTEIRYVKHPSSWLNAGAYDNADETPELKLVAGGYLVDADTTKNPWAGVRYV